MMQYVELPGVDAPVSRVVQGAISLFALHEETRLKMLDAAVEGGITAFDTARCCLSEDNWVRRERATEVGRRLSLSLSQVALAWALHADFRPIVIVANPTIGEVEENIAAEGTVLAVADLDYIFSG